MHFVVLLCEFGLDGLWNMILSLITHFKFSLQNLFYLFVALFFLYQSVNVNPEQFYKVFI